MTQDEVQKSSQDDCPRCDGTGVVKRMLPQGLIDPGPDSPLGSAGERTCPDCEGSGKKV
jgi:DnaJ-class molecular chaperone